MCGIVGFNWENRALVERLSALLEHRGPEQEGYHVGDGVSMGHKRLKILDLSEKGRQPIYNENKTICITYNGEVYNFQDLREKLAKAGHTFVSRTDTEVLVHGYEEWGTGLLERVNGQFAFCILDSNKNIFLLARDRLGIKPLYYYDRDGRFMFGSEMKIFLEGGIEKRLSQYALNHYLLFGYTPSGQSILEDVKKLPPGSCIVYSLDERKVKQRRRYWSLQFADDPQITQEQAKRAILQKLTESVRARLVSDVPLGAFLSGGIDSSIIVALMREHVRQLNTFSIKFDYPGYNESRYAKRVSDMFGTDHHEIEFNAQSVRDLIDGLPYYYDEPFGDSSMIPACLVSQVAREYVTVSLSGTGGDELFGGYPRYWQLSVLKRLNWMPGLLRKALSLSVSGINTIVRSDKLSKLQVFLGPREQTWELYLKLFSYMFRSDQEKYELDEFVPLSRHFKYENHITSALNFDTNEYLPECLLAKEDRASMAVSLEVRVPFLDHEFVELAARIRPGLKVKGTEKKHILKEAFRGILPDQILYRKKKGFSVPLVHYFRKELKDFAYCEIFERRELDHYDSDFLRSLWQRHQSGHADYSRLFWSIMMFNLWHRRWMA